MATSVRGTPRSHSETTSPPVGVSAMSSTRAMPGLLIRLSCEVLSRMSWTSAVVSVPIGVHNRQRDLPVERRVYALPELEPGVPPWEANRRKRPPASVAPGTRGVPSEPEGRSFTSGPFLLGTSGRGRIALLRVDDTLRRGRTVTRCRNNGRGARSRPADSASQAARAATASGTRPARRTPQTTGNMMMPITRSRTSEPAPPLTVSEPRPTACLRGMRRDRPARMRQP